MKEIVVLKAKTYSYLKENSDENKKATGTKKGVIKGLNFKIIETV